MLLEFQTTTERTIILTLEEIYKEFKKSKEYKQIIREICDDVETSVLTFLNAFLSKHKLITSRESFDEVLESIIIKMM